MGVVSARVHCSTTTLIESLWQEDRPLPKLHSVHVSSLFILSRAVAKKGTIHQADSLFFGVQLSSYKVRPTSVIREAR